MKSESFESVLNRRRFLQATFGTALASVLPSAEAAASAEASFTAISSVPAQTPLAGLVIPPGYAAQILIRWGDPLFAQAPALEFDKQSPVVQQLQFGYNNDFVGFLPLPFGTTSSHHGLLVVNHEYCDPELMFAGYVKTAPTPEQAAVCMEAVGLSVVEIRKQNDGTWEVVRDSRYNRRITAHSPTELTGPAAGHAWVQTAADPTGRHVLGTMNNCSAGKTPWGTVLSGEENFQDCFVQAALLPDGPMKQMHLKSYGLSEKKGVYEQGWSRVDARFDVSQHPHEPNRFGWIVEVDPYEPNSIPKKRTALGRIRHEAATFAQSKADQAILYTGDDDKFQFIYKFISAGKVNRESRQANASLLDEGTLHVARFHEDGSGTWLPLVFGQGPLTPAHGFHSQAEVLIDTRRAAKLLGATAMDRPEDIETDPRTGLVYVVLTKNADRGKEGKPCPDKANPRADNRTGHIIEMTEDGGDHGAVRFQWTLFLTGGPASKDRPALACPDNIAFGVADLLWIATDGAPEAIKMNDGLFAVPTRGSSRGVPKQFLSAPTGAEVCGPEFTPDLKTLFLAIQHPGEGGSMEKPLRHWPDGNNSPPRPSVVAIRKLDDGVIGT